MATVISRVKSLINYSSRVGSRKRETARERRREDLSGGGEQQHRGPDVESAAALGGSNMKMT